MSSVVSGITAITTISAITLSDDWGDIVEHGRELWSWLHGWLPHNTVVRALFYCTATVAAVKFAPIFLRETSFFKNVEHQNRYFHRTTCHPQLLEKKSSLLKELNDDTHNLPLYKNNLVLLELNAGGGTNLSYYPDNCKYIATDYWEDAKSFLEHNFPEDEEDDEIPRIKLDRFLNTRPELLTSIPDNSVSAVICIHSLCSSSNVQAALLEMKRVLLPGGKVYFMEHVRSKEKYSMLWLMQLNFKYQMYFWNCKFIHACTIMKMMKAAGFGDIKSTEFTLTDMFFSGPIKSLAPHICGVAVK